MTDHTREPDGNAQVKEWAGGPLRVFHNRREAYEKKDGTKSWRIVRDEIPYECDFVPFGEGFAIATPTSYSISGQLKIYLDIEMRNGRAACVAIRSEGPALTTSLLHKVPIEKELRQILRRAAKRLIWDKTLGEVIGEDILSPRAAADWRSWDERSEDVATATRTGRGRPPLTDKFLREVADAYREAVFAHENVVHAILTQWPDKAPSTARNWIREARKRGILEQATHTT
jgi:hypothetical protein